MGAMEQVPAIRCMHSLVAVAWMGWYWLVVDSPTMQIREGEGAAVEAGK